MIEINDLILTKSVKQLNIDNSPSKKHLKNLNNFLKNCLKPLEIEWNDYCIKNKLGNGGINIIKCYVSDNLNKIDSEKNEYGHLIGYAADTVPSNNKMKEYSSFLKEYFKNKNFDQLIEEKPRCGIPSWMHIGFKNENKAQRKQIFRLI